MSNIIALIVLGIFIYSIVCMLIALYGPAKKKVATFLWMLFLSIPVGIIIGLLMDIRENTETQKTE